MRITIFGVALLLLTCLTTPVLAGVDQSSSGREVTVTSALWIPLEGQIQAGDDIVTLSGKIHVMVRVVMTSDPTAPVEAQVHINVAEGKGVGTSGLDYRVVGAYHGVMTVNPDTGYLLHILVDVSSPVCHAPDPEWPDFPGFNLWFELTFSSDWSLKRATAVPCRECDSLAYV